MTRPQTIQIFLPDGTPTGTKEAEITNRLIKTILFSRTNLDKAAARKIVKYTGVIVGGNVEFRASNWHSQTLNFVSSISQLYAVT